MAACTDTDKTFHCCARMQEVAPRSSKPMVAGSTRTFENMTLVICKRRDLNKF
jgi:hypothetical protein